MRIASRTGCAEDGILCIIFAESQLMFARKKYYLCVNIHVSVHCFLLKEHSVCNGHNLKMVLNTTAVFEISSA